MLKHRVISSIVFNGKTITRGHNFKNNRPVGSLIQQVKIYNLREIDELIIYNIDGTILPKKHLDNISKSCFMPLAIGGGIRKIEDIEFLLEHGADKVILNTICANNTSFLKEAVKCFGSQAITVGVDYKIHNADIVHYIENGNIATGKKIQDWCKEIEGFGAGEIIITNIDRDGKQLGYNIDDTVILAEGINIPVVISGGAGKFDDFSNALNTKKIDAVCASSFYLFNQHKPSDVKEHLQKLNIPVRLSYTL